MRITRRGFLLRGGALGAALLAPIRAYAKIRKRKVRATLNTDLFPPFVDPLPILPIARPVGVRANPADPHKKIPYYRIRMAEFSSKLHRDMKPTRQWGYESAVPGPILETRSGNAMLVEWVNALPQHHFLPIDYRIHGAERGTPEVRAVVHLHGGKTPPESDGYPESWYQPGESAVCHYPSRQDAAMLWYHDHAMGINRLNIFAGLMGLFIVRDDYEDSLNLPRGKYEIPLIIYDRSFDSGYQLYYPETDDPRGPWIEEYFGDTMLVNGKVYPYLEVEPRKYRFRLLNGANGRFFQLSLSRTQSMYQIGTDLGLLPEPVELRSLTMAPAERADLVIDFTGHEGQQILLKDEGFDLLQFRVSRQTSRDSSALPAKLRPVVKLKESEAVKTRMLTLSTEADYVGTMLLNNLHWSDPVTEKPVLDTEEIWSLINLTDDSHPIHLHLVRFQILDRQRVDIFEYAVRKKLRLVGERIPPEPNEAGWKDTVRANPGMLTRIIVRFQGYAGRYVWHCHILEHEDNEMMRPYEILPPHKA